MARKIVQWAIYKKTQGVKYPGEYWEGCKSESDAKKKLREAFNYGAFRIVKTTLEAVE